METQRLNGLQQSLNALAAAAALMDGADKQAVSAQADALVAWMREALAELPSLAQGLGLAQRVAEGLRRGFDPQQGLERLNQALEAGFQALERVQAPAAAAVAPAPHPRVPEAVPVSGAHFLAVGPEDQDGWRDFLSEGPDLLAALESHLVGVLRDEAFEPGTVLRPLHTLKGICGMLGLSGFNQLLHACEDRLQPYDKATRLPKDRAQEVLAAMDLLRAQIDAIAAGHEQGGFQVLDTSELESRLSEGPADDGAMEQGTVTSSSDAEPAQRAVDNVIRIPVAKMDSLLEAVSELAICQAQVTAGVLDLNLSSALTAEAGRLEKISRQLQKVVLGLRMVPVQPLFTRLSRQAHDLSQRMGKPLRVELSGGETEVDKGLVEELFEPLLHLLRNALDHGLDTPQQRRDAGKPAEGLLQLKAFHQGGEFVLQMSDDGRGFDLAAIAAKARSRGLLRAGDEPSPEWLVEQVFLPGFSTAAELTDLSGRGVGLDAVRRKVSDLKGAVTASSVAGRGSVFTLRLPLTMALMEAILVRTRAERYALPAASVLRFLAWDATARHAVGQGEAWFEAAGRSLPIIDLGAEGEGRAVAMHVSAGGKEACLVVDEVLGKQQVVIKALGGLLKDLPGLGGGAVLADGRVGLILDLDSLLKQQALA